MKAWAASTQQFTDVALIAASTARRAALRSVLHLTRTGVQAAVTLSVAVLLLLLILLWGLRWVLDKPQ